jgi:RNA-directed DNA polymerase
MGKIDNFPLAALLFRWLKAVYIDKDGHHDIEKGTPQVGIISPLLSNIALDGLEKALGVSYRLRNLKRYPYWRWALNDSKSGNAVSYIRYVDDLVVLCEFHEAAQRVKKLLSEQLFIGGLELSEEKTRITNINDGFDFLGCTVGSYVASYNVDGSRGAKRKTFKILITPSKDALKKYRNKLSEIFKKYRGSPVGLLLKEVNPVIRGWTIYYKPFVSRKAFEAMDNYLFQLEKRFILRTHPDKGHEWLNSRYFGTVEAHPKDKWVFRSPENPIIFMLKHRWTPIQRHTLVSTGYNFHDPYLSKYWELDKSKGVTSSLNSKGDLRMGDNESHSCPLCMESL